MADASLDEEFLLADYFSLWASGAYLRPKDIAGRLDVGRDQATDLLATFNERGLISTKGVFWSGSYSGPQYLVTDEGRRAAETLRRARGLRHDAIVHQQRHALSDLIPAILMVGHINQRFGSPIPDGSIPHHALTFYLDTFTPNEIDAACERLQEDDLLTRHLDTHVVTMKGERRYDSDIGPRLGIEPSTHILKDVLGKTIDIFYSWQNEFKRSRSAIKDALGEVIQGLNALHVTRPIHLRQATAVGDGAIRIDVAIEERIRASHIFVADITPVAADGTRVRLNDNVLLEVGFALAAKGHGRVVLVSVERPELTTGRTFAFDIANVQRLPFDLTKKSAFRSRLRVELTAILERHGWLAR